MVQHMLRVSLLGAAWESEGHLLHMLLCFTSLFFWASLARTSHSRHVRLQSKNVQAPVFSCAVILRNKSSRVDEPLKWGSRKEKWLRNLPGSTMKAERGMSNSTFQTLVSQKQMFSLFRSNFLLTGGSRKWLRLLLNLTQRLWFKLFFAPQCTPKKSFRKKLH